jgi:hypothetical protein
MNRIDSTASNSSSIVACVLVASGSYLISFYLQIAVFSGSTIPDYWGGGGGTQTNREHGDLISDFLTK